MRGNVQKLLLLLVSVVFSTAEAGVLDELKSTPASRYEVGKMKLEILAHDKTESIKGQGIKGTSFEVRSFSVEETEGKLALVVSLVGKAKDISEEKCKALVDTVNEKMKFEGLARELWGGLTERQYQALGGDLVMKAKLIAKENEAFAVSCM